MPGNTTVLDWWDVSGRTSYVLPEIYDMGCCIMHYICPQQPDGWSCGFYVASYIGKLWSFLKDTSVKTRDWVNGVSYTVM